MTRCSTKDFLGVLCRALRTMLGQTIQSNDLHLHTTNRASPLDAKINVKDRILQVGPTPSLPPLLLPTAP